MGRSAIRRLALRPGQDQPRLVRAAGGVLLRRATRGRVEVVAVHRPGRDDWSLPKGKLETGESFEACALREVAEETGYECVLGSFAGLTEYLDRRGRPKVVAYWYMDPAPGASFHRRTRIAAEEVDEVCWLELAVACRVLSYPHDRELLSAMGTEGVARYA